ncbi:hypothetical protein [Streptomyces sp. NPDC006270]|uniref:hypothetical protein n=1 Tax=Streptomyces sp. NPDC006270 TaxID=3364741 RepID=UPI0036762495
MPGDQRDGVTAPVSAETIPFGQSGGAFDDEVPIAAALIDFTAERVRSCRPSRMVNGGAGMGV